MRFALFLILRAFEEIYFMEDILKKVYNPYLFRQQGHALVDLLAQYLENAQSQTIPVNSVVNPEDQFRFWENFAPDNNDPIALFKEIISRSIHIQHPHYVGHQVSPPLPLAALSGLLSSVLNNGMAIYEMGPAATAIEKVVVRMMIHQIGFPEGADGLLTSGGTIGNLTALLAARQQIAQTDIWESGLTESFGVMVSSEAHYSIDRAVRVMGLGSKGVIKIPVKPDFSMDTTQLESQLLKAQALGIKVFAVVGCAPSTSTGSHDDLEAIANFCQKHSLWFHVDAAHGGAAVFSPEYKPLLRGIEMADSVVIDGHKMLMMPALMTFVLFKSKHHSYATFNQKAGYLLDKTEEEDWYNMAKRTMECTKLMMGIRFYTAWKIYGENIFSENVTRLYRLGNEFGKLIQQRPRLELALPPQSNIVCFRYVSASGDEKSMDQINAMIRHKLLHEGEFYVVQTVVDGSVYLRTTLMNPFTDISMLETLLDRVVALANEFETTWHNS